MSQQIASPEEDAIYGQIRSILKPMINTALSEMPKDPVNNSQFNFINILSYFLGRFHDSMVTNQSGTGTHGENLEKNELEILRKELKHYRKKYEKELKDIEIMSEDEEPLGQEEQKNIDEEMKRKRQMKKNKRPTISDEPLLNSELLADNENNNINRQEQSGDLSEKFEKFKEKIQTLYFFKYLTPFELNEVLSSFQTETFNEGDTIFKQGAKADKLFFIEKGEITCWKTMRPEDPMTFIKTYKEGDSFGELALMYDYTRNYTIIAKTSVVLFSLDRKTYKNIVQGNIIRMRENYKNILEKVDILQTLTPEEISKILDIIEEREYKEGEDIVKQNANEDDFFILYNGKCHSEKISDSGKAPQLLNKYELFEFFGEIPWFKLEARNYIVKADEDCNVLVISKKKFKRLVGTLENILKRKPEVYQKFMKK